MPVQGTKSSWGLMIFLAALTTESDRYKDIQFSYRADAYHFLLLGLTMGEVEGAQLLPGFG